MVLTLAVFLAGGLGALTRYAFNATVVRWWKARASDTWARFPAGVFLINVSGAAVLGLITGYVAANATAAANDFATIVGVGFLGAYTTFSTEEWQELGLLRSNATMEGVALLGSLFASLLLAGLGLWLGGKL
jgi:CrcB protein